GDAVDDPAVDLQMNVDVVAAAPAANGGDLRPAGIVQLHADRFDILDCVFARVLELEALDVDALEALDDLANLRLLGLVAIEEPGGHLEQRPVERHIDRLDGERGEPLEIVDLEPSDLRR